MGEGQCVQLYFIAMTISKRIRLKSFLSRKTAERAICGLLSLIMLATLFVMIAPHFLNWQFEAILSGSMSPALDTGELVVVFPVNPNAIQIGDIIVFHPPREPDTLIVHRVVAIESGSPLSFQTKGDANPSADAYLVPAYNVVGKVRFHIPLLGHFTRFAQSTLGFILLLAIPGTIIIALELAKLKNLVGAKETARVISDPEVISPSQVIFLSRPLNSAPQPQGGSPFEGLKITPGNLQGAQFLLQTDAKGEVVSINLGRVPPGYSQLSGDTLRLKNLTEGALKVAVAIDGEISRFCRHPQLTMASWTMERKLRGNPLILHQGEEARLEFSLFIPFSLKSLGNYHGELVISTDNGAIVRCLQLFITISNPEVSA